MASKYNYKAYISYNHRDAGWAKWLHRAIEAYRVPRKLVGIKTSAGEVPGRIKPVFRDRDDLSSAVDLSSTVKKALLESENLIVVCSPNAAASVWVNKEIREFVSLGRQDRIFCVIVDGDPIDPDSASACFPAALSEAGLDEPLAADARKWADGKHLARLKLIAGMLGLPLDRLQRRDLKKRQKIWAVAAVASIAIAAVLISAVSARIAAQQRRDSGELLVSYKLNELRSMLQMENDPEDLGRLEEWDNQALAALMGESGTTKDALVSSAMESRDLGIALWQKSNLDAAMEVFAQSWALLAAGYQQDRGDRSVFFELGQAEFWIGQVYVTMGQLASAEEAFMAYAEITRRLIVQQPDNAEWVLEMAYALTNLGMVQKGRDVINPERAMQFMQSALEYNQIALVLDPNNPYYLSELGQSHANLADAQLGICDLKGAWQSRQTGVTLEADLLATDSENPRRKMDLAYALTGRAYVQMQLGADGQAILDLERALELITAASIQNPGAKMTRRLLVERKLPIIRLDARSGRLDDAWVASGSLEEDWQRLLRGSGLDDFHTVKVYATYLLDRAGLAKERGDLALAERLLQTSIDHLTVVLHKSPNNREVGNILTLAAYQYWEAKKELPPESILALLPDYGVEDGRTRACVDASRAVRKAIMLGDKERAGELVSYLSERGYRGSDFIRVCTENLYCDEKYGQSSLSSGR